MQFALKFPGARCLHKSIEEAKERGREKRIPSRDEIDDEAKGFYFSISPFDIFLLRRFKLILIDEEKTSVAIFYYERRAKSIGCESFTTSGCFRKVKVFLRIKV